jgi:tetratricopeptide (TPR) repeat protein
LGSHPDDLQLEGLASSLTDDESWSVLEHLAGCRSCQRRLELMIEGKKTHRSALGDKLGKVLPWPAEENDYDSALDRVFSQAMQHHAAFERERSATPVLLAELFSHGPAERTRLVSTDPRLHSWALFEGLLERSREEAFLDSKAAAGTAHLALLLVERLPLGVFGPAMLEDARSRCWSHLGNARRLQSDLTGAEEAFETANHHLLQGTGDAMERAQLSELRASLLSDQRRFDGALRLLRRSLTLYRQAGETHRAGRCLVQMSTVLQYSGDPEGAIPLLYDAIPMIDPAREPRLLLCARHNLIDYLAETGRFMEAQKLFAEARALYAEFPDAWAQNRRLWVRGKIARGLGQIDDAEKALAAAREGFVREGVAYDAALASLDLACLYAAQRRNGDLARLAREMTPIFVSREIHREALAALAFFCQAVEAERIELEVVAGVSSYLKRAEHDPGHRFEAP